MNLDNQDMGSPWVSKAFVLIGVTLKQKSILGVWHTIHLLVWCKLQVSNIYESMLDSSQ